MPDRSDVLEVEYARGPSGLRLARQAAPSGSPSFAATLVAPAGWAYEPSRAGGTARLSGLLLTSGAGRRDRRALARYLDRAGATLTSSVDPESAEVTVWGPAALSRELLAVLADAALRPRFARADVARVRRQLLERQMRDRTQPGHRVELEVHRALYPAGHPYRSNGTGDRRSVPSITAETLRRFHGAHFAGPAGVLVATGPISLDALRSVSGRLFEEWPSSGPSRPRLPTVRRTRPEELRFDLPGRSQVEVRLACTSIPRHDPAYPAAYLANEVLGGSSMLSRLYARVRGKGGLAYHASSHLESMRWGGTWDARAGTGEDRWKRVVPMLREEAVRLHDRTIPLPELTTVRESRIGELQLALESTSDAHELAVDVAYHELPADHWKSWPAVLRALAPADVRRAAAAAIDPSAWVSAVAGPLGRG